METGRDVQVAISLTDSLADAESVATKRQETRLVAVCPHTRRFNRSHQADDRQEETLFWLEKEPQLGHLPPGARGATRTRSRTHASKEALREAEQLEDTATWPGHVDSDRMSCE